MFNLILILIIFLSGFPFSDTVFAAATSSITISVKIPPRPGFPPAQPPASGGGGGGWVLPAPLPTKVVVKGFSSPRAFVYIYKDGKLAATLTATPSGTFSYELTGLYGRIYEFTFAAEDQAKRPTMTVSIKVSVLAGAITTIENIFLPPTFEVLPRQVIRGEEVIFSGSTHPKSVVTAAITLRDMTKQTVANERGDWQMKIDSRLFPDGAYGARASAQSPAGLQSPATGQILFTVTAAAGQCRGADINRDGKVNIYDFSILMFWWRAVKIIHPCADINKDGQVNLIDFSIMMHAWTKK
ncbi:MAG: hypothetical protein AAB673_02790 [Patescibacteria group bacterium]